MRAWSVLVLATLPLAGCLENLAPIGSSAWYGQDCPTARGCPIPAVDAAPGVVFLLQPEYGAGATVEVSIRNVGPVAYAYRTHYTACDLTYWTASGQRFIIPPGTHCDLANRAALAPGDSTRLFNWSLDECTKDTWGCAAKRPLAPGTYHVRGDFHPVVGEGDAAQGGSVPADPGNATRAGATFRIV